MADGNVAAREPTLPHAVDQRADGALRTARLTLDDDPALVAGAADSPHAQRLGKKARHLVHTAVFDQVIEGRKRENHLGFIQKRVRTVHRLVEADALAGEPFNLTHAKDQLRTG